MSRFRYSPEELLEKYRVIRATCTRAEFMSSPKHQKTQELWCAAHFSRAYEAAIGPCWVHISERDEQLSADFWFEFEGNLHPFQVTEVLQPGRKRGDEYRRLEEGVNVSVLEDWSEGTEFGASWVAARIKAKAEKYGADAGELHLLVYLNFQAYAQDYSVLRSTTAEYAAHFRSVWLLSGNAFCCVKATEALQSIEDWHGAAESLLK